MKKTISIHLMGTNFLVEEDAYELVHNYLERLKNSLKNSNDQKEICEDVELRIAELAAAYLTEKKQVVTLGEMQQIISTLGQPEDFLEEDMQQEPGSKSSSESYSKTERRLFRDGENVVVAGVCSGLAAYFKVDPVIFRILFVLFFFAGALPLYILMWIIVPTAKSNVERLQMQGRPINLETLKEEFGDATQRFSKSARNFEREISDKNSPVRQRINYFGNALAKLIGFCLIIFGCLNMVLLFIAGFVDMAIFPFNESGNDLNFNEFADLTLIDNSNSLYLWLGGFIAGLSYVIFIILLGSVLLFKLRSKWIKRSFLVLVATGITGIVILSYQGVRLASDYSIPGEYETKIGETSDSTLNVNILESLHPNYVNSGRDYDFRGKIVDIENGKIIETGIDIYYALSEDSSFHVYAEYSAHGNGEKSAVERSKHISHEIRMEGNTLTMAPYYRFPKADKIRNQSVTLTIQIPAGKKVKFKDYVVTSNDIRDSGEIRKNGTYEHYIEESDEDNEHWEDIPEKINIGDGNHVTIKVEK